MPRLGCYEAHRRIVHRFTGRVQDCAPIAPACPRPAIDSHNPTGLGISHALSNQPNEPLLLLHDHHAASGLPPNSHRNLRVTSVLRRCLESAHPWVGSTASIGRFWAAADAAGRSLTCPLPAQRVHRGSRVQGGRRPSQRDALAPLTREGCTRRRRGPDLHARMGTQSRCSEIDPRKRHKRWEWALARPLAGG